MRPWSSALLSLSIYPAVEKSLWNISRAPSISKMLGPCENKQCLVTAWLWALGDSKMSLAVLRHDSAAGKQACKCTGLGWHAWAPLKCGS